MKKEKENRNHKICCFFGHRDVILENTLELQMEIERLIEEEGIEIFYVGGHGSFDGYVTRTMEKIKKKHKNIKLILVLAYLSTLENNKFYIESKYNETIYPDGLEAVPQRYAITKRNTWIVDHWDFCIAYVKKSYGGVYTALKRAEKRKLKTVNLAEKKNNL